MIRISVLIAAAIAAASTTAHAQLAVVPNDNKLYLVNGTQTVAKTPAGDSVSILDLSVSPPKLVATIDGIPVSVIGPPFSTAITPDESLALVTASMKVNTADPTKQIEDNRVTVIDLKASPPKVLATIEVGKGPAAISINRAGSLALVSNRGEGTVSVLTISGKTVKHLGKVEIGNAASALGHVGITPDGKRALLSRDGENLLTVLNIDGEKVTRAGQDIAFGPRPYGLQITPDGKLAFVATIGATTGNDSLGIIDLTATPPKLAQTIQVGQTAEGVTVTRDGKFCAVLCHDGSAKAKESPLYHDHGNVYIYAINGTTLTRITEAPVGGWSQGITFSNDGKTLVVTNMVEKELQFLTFDGKTLKDAGPRMKMPGGPAAIRVAEQ